MKPWTWRHAIINSSLPATTRHVLLTLACHVNDAGEDAYPSTKTLARETGLSERSICTHLDLAASLGWFIVRKHGYGGQKWARNQYFPRVPVDFEISTTETEGTEGDSAPKKPRNKNQALKDVQQLVDKGAETGSVPSREALNVVHEGAERDDTKALKDVQSNTAVNPASNAAAREGAQDAAAAAQKIDNRKPSAENELTGMLLALEAERGKRLTIDRNRDRVLVLTWVGRGVTDAQLREAHSRAVAARRRDSDDRAVNVGFLGRFIDEVLAVPSPSVTDDGSPWFESTAEVIEARGAELGVRPRKADEAIASYRVLVVNASREKSAVDFVLRDAKKFNDQRLYEFAVATFGDALMPTDFYA